MDSGVKEALKGVNERSLEAMLREMRKLDRDRDGVLPPSNISKFMDKFQVRIQGIILDHLYQRFVDNRFPDMINYEALMKYLLKIRTTMGKYLKITKNVSFRSAILVLIFAIGKERLEVLFGRGCVYVCLQTNHV